MYFIDRNSFYDDQQRRMPMFAGAFWTKWFIITCVAIFAMQLLAAAIFKKDVFSSWFWLEPNKVVKSFQIYRIFTCNFLHDINSIWHIFFNLFIFGMFAIPIERTYGRRKFLIFILYTCLFVGLVATVFYLSAGHSRVLGASGVVFAVLVAFGFKWPNQRILLFFIIPVRALSLILIYVGFELYYLLVNSAAPGFDHVAHIAHLAGAAVGFLFIKFPELFQLKNPFSKTISNHRARKSIKEEEYVNSLFDKISRQGINSLTDSERRFLDDYSRRKRGY